MAQTIELKKGVYEAAKISSRKATLLSSKEIETLKSQSYSEILKYLEEHGFKDVIDKSYLNYEGFYLIEKILNDYLTQHYDMVFRATSKQNKQFLNLYYLKYQIHNLMALLRCRISQEEELSSYLIGEKRQQEKFLKAFTMPEDDALRYISKKLSLDENSVIHYYHQDLFDLENYLYKHYYTQLLQQLPIYQKKQDKTYKKYLELHIDLLNSRVHFMLENEQRPGFEELYIKDGTITEEEFQNSPNKYIFSLLTTKTKTTISSVYHIDRAINNHKKKGSQLFSKVPFGSPYQLLGYLLTVEEKIGTIRTLLKAKYMNINQQELDEVINSE